MSLLDLENMNVFCVTRNGVIEGYHFLTLLPYQPPSKRNKEKNKKVPQRSRTSSLPPSFDISCSHYEDSEKFCPPPVRSVSYDDVVKMSRIDSPVKILKQCVSTWSDLSHLSIKRQENIGHQGFKILNRRKKRKEVKISVGVKIRKSNKMRKSRLGIQCSGTVVQMDGYMLSYFVTGLRRSEVLRKSFIRRWGGENAALCTRKEIPQAANLLIFIALLAKPQREALDMLGNKMVNSNILYRRSLEHALSWLSTLGGAFSALGDLSLSYAEEAGHVSLTQLRIAMKLGDPGIESRCRLYAAISLLQRGYLKSCRDIVRKEYAYATSLTEGTDIRLRRMCLGIWAKLQYHWKLTSSVDKKSRKSTFDGLQDIKNNVKYRSVYDLEEGRKVIPFENGGCAN